MTKSYCTVEQKICHICSMPYDTGAILLDRKMRSKFDMHTISGWGICSEHQEKLDEGFMFFVEIIEPNETIQKINNEDAKRTGRYLGFHKSLIKDLFEKHNEFEDTNFVDKLAFELLKDLAQIEPEEGQSDEEN